VTQNAMVTDRNINQVDSKKILFCLYKQITWWII